MNIRNAEVAVGSDLYEAGRACDGHPFIAEVYFVEITFPNGRRLRHDHRFPGCVVSFDEDSDGEASFGDVREEAKAKAERLAARVAAAGEIDSGFWREARPVYGSAAYSSEDEVELERREEEFA